MDYYKNLTQNALDDSKSIAQDLDQWTEICGRHGDITATFEQLRSNGESDDMFADCYREARDLLNMLT